MMVYNTWDYWVFGLCPSSGVLKNNVSELDLFPSSGTTLIKVSHGSPVPPGKSWDSTQN
jgi:hypothetical protein